MESENLQLRTTTEFQSLSQVSATYLTNEQVKRLQHLRRDFEKLTLQENKSADDAATAIRKQLDDEGDPWADVWTHSVLKGYVERDAKYRVICDWIGHWVDRLKCDRHLRISKNAFADVEQVGGGAFGEVFRATQRNNGNRDIAIKLLRPKDLLSKTKNWESCESDCRSLLKTVSSFISECTMVMKIEPSSCVPVLGASLPSDSTPDGVLRHLRNGPVCFWMPFVEGGNLRRLFSQSPKTPGEFDNLIDVMRKVAEALKELHVPGFIHRDLKPENILVDREGKVWLSDFGMATERFEQAVSGNPVSGTLLYMAPEQIQGLEAIAQTDIWAWGAMFFELSTGRPLFQGKNVRDIQKRILNGAIDHPRTLNNDIPKWLQAIVMKCLRREIGGDCPRYGSFADVLEDLDRENSSRMDDKGITDQKIPPSLADHPRRRKRLLAFVSLAALSAAVATIVFSVSIGWIERNRADTRYVEIATTSTVPSDKVAIPAESQHIHPPSGPPDTA